eukprot:GHVU01151840.1.p1 GENE.GHVU01151840.1~~GHVU01151840.1.p1  ORF type:complete len:163 (-),score=7.25 GHVU01151840.1:20-508(-)
MTKGGGKTQEGKRLLCPIKQYGTGPAPIRSVSQSGIQPNKQRHLFEIDSRAAVIASPAAEIPSPAATHAPTHFSCTARHDAGTSTLSPGIGFILQTRVADVHAINNLEHTTWHASYSRGLSVALTDERSVSISVAHMVRIACSNASQPSQLLKWLIGVCYFH